MLIKISKVMVGKASDLVLPYSLNLLQPEPGIRQPVQSPPQQPVHRDYDRRHYDCRGQQELEVSVVGGLADHRAQPRGREYLSFQVKVFRNNAGVPCAA